jgi:hypothetical protein
MRRLRAEGVSRDPQHVVVRGTHGTFGASVPDEWRARTVTRVTTRGA